ncbi:HAMP domain-containing sensor histidine kinase [Soonwooa sp.]|uniref:HAMP domain-containing sensor histidine kinase n=1 Tax=Soonwooa sp. TaxID=1938592 RepID=UPI00261CDC9F|nr:HAMP domain-containing sensor histidine kinase [Soonwooa sp.]
MTLRKRFILISSLSYGVVSIITFIIIYVGYYDSSQQVYLDRLKNKALISAIYYLEKDELPKERHAEVKKEYNHLMSPENVAIFDEKNQLTYGGNIADFNIKVKHLQQARSRKTVEFMSDDFFYYGIFYKDNQGDFVVFVKNSNSSFKDQMFRLSMIMLAGLLLGLLFIIFLSMQLSKIVYKPISKVVKQINNADYTDISKAITSTNTNDEIEELIKSYNKLLSHISENVLLQQNFINYVSHEFKTPLASISGNLEVFAQRERSPEEYQKVAKDALNNVYQIEHILNNLLLMSGLSKIENSHRFVRIDEIIWKIYENILPKTLEYHTQIHINLEVKNPESLQYSGNETLLYLAFYNIIENAVKYSNQNPVQVLIGEEKEHLVVTVTDQGAGVNAEDLAKIYDTFFRGKNVKNINGSGIGLSLSKTIFEHHHIKIEIKSEENLGTSVKLVL